MKLLVQKGDGKLKNHITTILVVGLAFLGGCNKQSSPEDQFVTVKRHNQDLNKIQGQTKKLATEVQEFNQDFGQHETRIRKIEDAGNKTGLFALAARVNEADRRLMSPKEVEELVKRLEREGTDSAEPTLPLSIPTVPVKPVTSYPELSDENSDVHRWIAQRPMLDGRDRETVLQEVHDIRAHHDECSIPVGGFPAKYRWVTPPGRKEYLEARVWRSVKVPGLRGTRARQEWIRVEIEKGEIKLPHLNGFYKETINATGFPGPEKYEARVFKPESIPLPVIPMKVPCPRTYQNGPELFLPSTGCLFRKEYYIPANRSFRPNASSQYIYSGHPRYGGHTAGRM